VRSEDSDGRLAWQRAKGWVGGRAGREWGSLLTPLNCVWGTISN